MTAPAERPQSARVVCYVDGFNLYHGIKDHSNCRYYRWLDLRSLAESLLLSGHQLERVVFFTSVPPWDTAKARRHQTYTSALVHSGVEIVQGRFQHELQVCGGTCLEPYPNYVEKLTDVNISTRILTDAVQGRVDWVYLLSGDADQAPTIRALRKVAPSVKVHAIFPPRRASADLRTLADRAYGELGQKKLKAHQFPHKIETPGYTIRKPTRWVEQEANGFAEATEPASPTGP